MEEQSKEEQGKRLNDDDVEGHVRKKLVEDPGSEDEHGKRRNDDDDDVQAHIRKK